MPLAGRPLVEWSLAAFRDAGCVAAIVVAAPPGHEGELDGAGVTVIAGGAHRSESVANALAAVETDLVAVHDAARPLVSAELIDALAAELAEREDLEGVIAAAPVTDTVKEAAGERVVERTLDRSRLWAAQTPQLFRTEALRRALAGADLAAATDDAMLVEAAGGRVGLHEPAGPNLKVTTAVDLRLAEMILAGG